ncbi:MAG TPA: peptidoglycan-binding domain-containing protein [Alphaproteobacteria bacterium]|nr:peptidoglycan-binding domain-containing protein [Alphaproteobacteria bacterium]
MGKRILIAVALALLWMPPVEAQNPEVLEIQRALSREGYDAGSPDGILGPRTRAAIQAFQMDRGLQVTGEPSADLLAALEEPPRKPENPSSARPLQALTIPDALAAGGAGAAPKASPDPLPQQGHRPVRHFAPRNWLIQDKASEDNPAPEPFGVFLEVGGSVAGPRYADRLRWQAESRRFTMTYRNSIGQEIVRTGRLNGSNRIEGKATGPLGKSWDWVAESEPR